MTLDGDKLVNAVGVNGKLFARRTEDAVVDDIVTGRWARHCQDESKWETIELWGLNEEQRFSPAALITRKMEDYASSHLIIFSLRHERSKCRAQYLARVCPHAIDGRVNRATCERLDEINTP